MKTTILLTPALRTAITSIVSRLPSCVSVAVGVDNESESPEPYFMVVRLTAAGTLCKREHITFQNEQQVFEALMALQQTLGLPAVTAKPAPKKFADLDNELANMSMTAASVA